MSLVPDTALRKALEREVADLKKRLTWGLVFERHIPETTVLLDAPIRPGAIVWERRAAKPRRFRVRSVENGDVVAVLEAEGEAAEADAPTERLPRADVLLEKPFGEPVYPALTSLGAVRQGAADKPTHAVIEGENFHALQALLIAYEGQVDCIYLDPPYNTGAEDWKYNNRFVDKNDAWQHSKWLSFMEKRLVLARRLLRPDGVLVVTIDEHEVSHLGMLLEQVFKDYDRQMITTVINPKGTIRGNFGRVEEYAFFCVPITGRKLIAGRRLDGPPEDEELGEDEEAVAEAPMVAAEAVVVEETNGDVNGNGHEVDDEDEVVEDLEEDVADPEAEVPAEVAATHEFQLFRRRGSSSLREDRWRRFYPIWIDEAAKRIVTASDAIPLGEEPDMAPRDGLRPIWPIDSEGNHRVWRWQASRVREIVALGEPDEEGRYLTIGRYSEELDNWTINLATPRRNLVKQKTVWWEKRHDAGTHGTTLLQRFLGKSRQFSFPKSVYLVRDTLDIVVRHRPDALILDFFAGSGTTMHATWMLNEADEGRRRCVLVTNNELEAKTARRLLRAHHYPGDPEYEVMGVFENVTRPRLVAALTGKRANGVTVPGRYLDRTPFSKGFAENVEFFRLDYLDPADVELGRSFEALLPVLWLQAGAVGERAPIDTTAGFALPEGSPYAFLFDPSGVPGLLAGLGDRPDVTHAFITAETDEAFADLAGQLPERLRVRLLYRPYLDAVRGMRA